MMASGRAILDFGDMPGSATTSVAVSLPTISDGKHVAVNVIAKATDDHSADEHVVDPPLVTATEGVSGTGFTIYGQAREGLAYGQWFVRWSYEP